MAACMRAISRVSPAIELESTSVRNPSWRAWRAAAASARRLPPITVLRMRAKSLSPGLGVSSIAAATPCSIRTRTAAGTLSRMPYRSSTAAASRKVDGSGAAGPEPITSGLSPITSETSSASTFAGHARRASRPPLIADKCLRTALISWMSAPHASSSRVTSCFSASVIGGAGSGSSAEAPPEIRHSTRSPTPAAEAISAMRSAPAAPRWSGTGCPHSFSSMRRSLATWPYLTFTRPPVTIRPNARSAARAMEAPALPAPIT